MEEGQQKGDASVYSHENKKFKSFIKTAERKLTTLTQFAQAQNFNSNKAKQHIKPESKLSIQNLLMRMTWLLSAKPPSSRSASLLISKEAWLYAT